MTLMKLTNHEAGIIIYGGNTVGVVNWGQCDDDQIPMLAPMGLGLISWPETPGVFDGAKAEYVPDIRDLIPGSIWLTDETNDDGTKLADTDLDIVFDEFGDLMRLFLDDSLTADDYEGTVYTLRDGRIIIAPAMWN